MAISAYFSSFCKYYTEITLENYFALTLSPRTMAGVDSTPCTWARGAGGIWDFCLPSYDVPLLWPQSLVEVWACASTWANECYFKISVQLSEKETKIDPKTGGSKSGVTGNHLATTCSLTMS